MSLEGGRVEQAEMSQFISIYRILFLPLWFEVGNGNVKAEIPSYVSPAGAVSARARRREICMKAFLLFLKKNGTSAVVAVGYATVNEAIFRCQHCRQAARR